MDPDHRSMPAPRVADPVVFRELDGEAVLLHLETGIYFGLDRVGTHIWRALERRDPLDRLVAGLVQEYEVDAATARADALRLIQQLTDKGLLVAG